MEEVVVNVGYQEQTVTTTTGSSSQISGEDLELEPTTNLTNSLQGTVPGLFGVNSSGRPGQDGSNLLVRGTTTFNNNSPLVVIDGVPGRQGGLARLNPSDIKNVSVLKDASAAIYGARAANGVILVTTKGGQAGETQIDVNVEQSFNQPTIIPEMADAPTYMQMINELDQYRGNPPRFSQEEIENHRGDVSNSWEYFDTDWYEVGFKNFTSQTMANAAVSGGIEDLRYRVSFRGVTENGIVTNSATRFNQFGLRSNLDGDVTENLTLSLNLHGRLEDRNYGTVPTWILFGRMQKLKPFKPARWPNGKPAAGFPRGGNPIVAGSPETGYDNRKTYRFQSNLSLEARVPAVEGLTLEATMAYDQTFFNRKRWATPYTLWAWEGNRDDNGDPILSPVEQRGPAPSLRRIARTNRDILARGMGQYETDIGDDHHVNLVLGSEYEKGEGSRLDGSRRFFSTDQIDQLFAGAQRQRAIRGGGWHSARLSAFSRLNYNYREKYLFEFVGRYDGSYKFAPDNRFGFFPSISAGWRLAQEDWFNAFTGDFFDRLKLRASYGRTGDDAVGPFQYLQTFRLSGQYAFEDELSPQFTPARVPNPDITWEKVNQLDVGIEGTILSERLTFDVAYFDYFRYDILLNRGAAIPQSTGFSLPDENFAEMSSQGLDGQFSYRQNITSDVSFQVGGNVSWAEDEIKYFAESPGQLPYQRATGKPLGSELFFIADGIFNDQKEIDNNPSWPGARPGDIRFKDINEDGKIDGDDRKRIEEDGRPDIMGGFNVGLTAYQFRLQTQFQGAAQVRKELFGRHGEFGNYFQVHAENRWSPDNKDGTWPRAFNRDDPYWAAQQNTFWYRDAKYLRLKTARLEYTLPSEVSEQVGVGNLQVYLTGRNLFTWTPMVVTDPEARGQGVNNYPQERTYTVGIQMDF
jgi:TonB-linked SusC/RagA family outer membrane protein